MFASSAIRGGRVTFHTTTECGHLSNLTADDLAVTFVPKGGIESSELTLCPDCSQHGQTGRGRTRATLPIEMTSEETSGAGATVLGVQQPSALLPYA